MSISLTWRGRSALLTGAAVIALTAACSTAADPAVGDNDRPAPRTSTSLPPVFYVDPESPAAVQVKRWQSEGRVAEADALRRIGGQPAAKWLTGGPVPVREQVDAFLRRATVAGQTPVLVAHNVPQRDCGRDGNGGAASGGAYRSWIREFAEGVAGRPVIVIVEPGAVADAVAGCIRNPAERYALLRDAISVIKGTGSARVYLDAGHPFWIKDVPKLVAGLGRAGIAEADGFALNVANFVRTPDNVAYGHRISDALGGETPFVIDTSRNGNGPHPADKVGGAPSFCNPPERALGEPPTDKPELPRVDALLWVKYPGESDGACRKGEPDAGHWWPEYALDLVRRAESAG